LAPRFEADFSNASAIVIGRSHWRVSTTFFAITFLGLSAPSSQNRRMIFNLHQSSTQL
jgi:hypothetical protein